MRELVLYGFIVFVSATALAIAAPPLFAWRRRRRWRRDLLACFAASFEDGAIRRVSYVRDRKCFGDGWIDTYEGSAGTMPFVFSVTIEPWVRAKTYRLHLVVGGRDPRTGESPSQDYVFAADPDKAPDALHVRFHRALVRMSADANAWRQPEAS